MAGVVRALRRVALPRASEGASDTALQENDVVQCDGIQPAIPVVQTVGECQGGRALSRAILGVIMPTPASAYSTVPSSDSRKDIPRSDVVFVCANAQRAVTKSF